MLNDWSSESKKNQACCEIKGKTDNSYTDLSKAFRSESKLLLSTLLKEGTRHGQRPSGYRRRGGKRGGR